MPLNRKAPGLLDANLKPPGELCLILDEPNIPPGREELRGRPDSNDWNRYRVDEAANGRAEDEVDMKPKRKGRLTEGTSMSFELLAGVAVTVGVKPSLVMVAEEGWKDVRLRKGRMSGRLREPEGRTGKLLRLVGFLVLEAGVNCSSGSSVVSSSGKASVTVFTGMVPVARSCSEESRVGVAKRSGGELGFSSSVSLTIGKTG